MNNPKQSAIGQTGSALIVALIFLLLMTLIGTSAMQISSMQERMASNWRDWNTAFQSAEAALREAETFLRVTVALPEFADADGYYQVNSPNRPVWHGDVQSDGDGSIEYASAALEGVAQPPRYFIEELSTIKPPGSETCTGCPLSDATFFRVTAVGYGGAVGDDDVTPITSVTLSTVYRSR
jgi:type IV pilus assembly protein PilX